MIETRTNPWYLYQELKLHERSMIALCDCDNICDLSTLDIIKEDRFSFSMPAFGFLMQATECINVDLWCQPDISNGKLSLSMQLFDNFMYKGSI